MGQRQGQTGNPHGRPTGSRNKTTTITRQWVNDLLTKNIERFEADLASLSPKDRLLFLEKLLAYVLPKPQSQVDNPNEDDFPREVRVTFRDMSGVNK